MSNFKQVRTVDGGTMLVKDETPIDLAQEKPEPEEKPEPTYAEDLAAKRWCRYVPKHERPVLGALIKLCLENDHTVSVHDGEEFVVNESTSYNLIKSQLGHTGEDQLSVLNPEGKQVGWFWLIYNNGSEEDVMVVMCDCWANDYCNAIMEKLSARYDT